MDRPRKRFDARVVSLYSRNMRDGMPDSLSKPTQFYSFSCFDAIEVAAVDIPKEENILKTAYKKALEKPDILQTLDGSPQFLLAFTDITSDPDQYGYSADAVERFWAAEQETPHPLFFMTLINVAEHTQLEEVLRKIKKTFPEKQHLTYLTFDHCDAVIFFRGDSFSEYARHIFPLYYTGDIVLADAITIFSFTPNASLYTDSDPFKALVRVGVRDYGLAETFYQKIKTGDLQHGWLLERNDMWFYAPRATLGWLRDARAKAIELSRCSQKQEPPWFTTYELTILVEMEDIQPSPPPAPIYTEKLKEKMEAGYRAFACAYIEAVDRLKLAQDRVWLRWLKESSNLAVSLMESQLSTDLGTCLVPQFLDMFQYTSRLFSSPLMNRDAVEAIQRSFSTFFSNIAILIDSMNQSNSQFVQVPSFHLTSFEMPPQLMAFYIAMAYRLKDALQDDRDNIYGFTISPKFIKSLGVLSLALQDVLPKDQWLEMVISESSLYTLQLTAETMAHEVSHFAAQGNRSREERKMYEIKYAFHELITYILDRLPGRMRKELSGVPTEKLLGKGKTWDGHVALDYDMRQLLHASDKFWDAAKELEPFSVDKENLSADVFNLTLNLSSLILEQPELFRCVSDCVWEIAFLDDRPGDSISLMQIMRNWSDLEYETVRCEGDRLTKSALGDGTDRLALSLIKSEANHLVESLLTQHRANIRQSVNCGGCSEEYDLLCKIQYMFSETFADLQAILLFQLDWRQYCAVLNREEDVEFIKDVPPRMLAIAKALLPDFWNKDSISSEKSMLKGIEAVVFEDPVTRPSKFRQISISEDGSETVDIEVGLLYYLTEYLRDCKAKIEVSLEENPSIKELRAIHNALSDESSVLNLQKTLMGFIHDFRQRLCGPSPDGAAVK